MVFTVVRASDARDGLVIRQVLASEKGCLEASAALVSLMAFPWVVYMYVGGKEWSGICWGSEPTCNAVFPSQGNLACWPLMPSGLCVLRPSSCKTWSCAPKKSLV